MDKNIGLGLVIGLLIGLGLGYLLFSGADDPAAPPDQGRSDWPQTICPAPDGPGNAMSVLNEIKGLAQQTPQNHPQYQISQECMQLCDQVMQEVHPTQTESNQRSQGVWQAKGFAQQGKWDKCKRELEPKR